MQQEYFGVGSISKIKEVLEDENPESIFLVTGNGSYSVSGVKDIIKPFLSKYKVTNFTGFQTIPQIEDVMKGIELFKKEECDLVIAIGGGCAIDIAKSINALSAQHSCDLEFCKKYVRGEIMLANPGKPMLAIPTTSGTGTEATHFAVLFIDGIKYSITHLDYVLPNYSIVDPSLTLSLPAKVTATTGIDAFCQAVESYWSVNSTDDSKFLASEAIKLTMENLEIAVNNPTDDSRIAMCKAANLAGKAINITKTTAPHALSYTLTSRFGIPHGHAVAISLGRALEFNSEVTNENCYDPRGVEHVKSTMQDLITIMGCTNVQEANLKFEQLMQSIGLSTNLFELGLKENDLDIVTDLVNLERLKNNPRKFNSKEELKILLS